MSKTDISNYEVNLSDYRHLTQDNQNELILHNTGEKSVDIGRRISQQTLTESFAKQMQDTKSL